MSEFTLRPVQVPIVQCVLDNRRCCILAPMGSGKSSAVLVALDALLFSGQSRKILILAPLRVARGTWPNEIRRWSCFSHLRVSVVVGTAQERANALSTDADIYCMNYHVLPWVEAYLEGEWMWDTVVSDESIFLKSFRLVQGGKRAGALRKVAHTKVNRWINLTGMVLEKGLTDIWSQLWFLDQGQRLGRTYSAFIQRWFRPKLGSDPRYPSLEPMPHAQSEITDLIADVCLTIDPKDWFDLKEPIVNTLYVDLPDGARKHYREMERKLYTEIQGHAIEAFAAAGKSQKLSQLANGAAYLDPTTQDERDPKSRKWVEVHDEKVQAVQSVVNESGGMPILVAYHFKSDLARLKKAFPQGRQITLERDERDFKNGLIPIAFVHPQSIGHGVDGFQYVTNIIVFFGFNWAAGPYHQIIERIGPMRQMQAGMDRPVFIHHIVARNTIDEDVIACLTSKREVFEVLVEGIKRRNVL